MLNDSSQYWKTTFNNITSCNCDRENIVEEDKEEEDIIVNKINYNTDYPNVKEDGKMDIDNMTDVEIKKREDSVSLMSIDDSGRNSYSKRNWTAEEDAKLLKYVTEYNSHNWKKISTIFLNKTAQQCSYRYSKLISDINKSKWNRNDDILLLELIELYGHNWAYISSKMSGRSPEDIMQRYILKLDPKLKRSRFEKEEDDLILKLHDQYGNKWNEISKYFPNRNSAMIKNRYYSYLKKQNRDSYTGETQSNYSSSIATPTNRERNTISFMNVDKNKLFNDCDVDMFDNEMDGLLNVNYNKIDSETNTSSLRPSNDSHKLIDENSPKQKLLENNFDYQYNNVFNRYFKKDSFEDNLGDEYFVKNTKTNENENLYKQYQILETAFNKIYEISTFKSDVIISNIK
jgi:hypothetical protein